MTTNTCVCIYVPEHLAQEINKAAVADGRSRSSYIRRVIERALSDERDPKRETRTTPEMR